MYPANNLKASDVNYAKLASNFERDRRNLTRGGRGEAEEGERREEHRSSCKLLYRIAGFPTTYSDANEARGNEVTDL